MAKNGVKTGLRRVIGGLILTGLIAAFYFAVRPQPIDVDIDQVKRGPMQVTVNEDGRTRIRERYVVSAPLTGRLLRIALEPGDPVLQGTTRLAMITPRDPGLLDNRERRQAEARVKAQQAALDQTTPNMQSAKADLEYAEEELAQMRGLAKSGAAAVDTLERADRDYRVKQEAYRAAVVQQQIAKFELELARAALVRTREEEDGDVSDFEISSPISGAVLRVLQESSTVVNPGTPLVEVGDPADLEVVVDVLSVDAVQIRPGNSVYFDRWGGGKTLEGRVRLVEPSAFTKISSLGVEEQRVNVIIDLVDPPERRETLGDGFRVEARIVVWEAEDVAYVPSSALFRVGERWAVFRMIDGLAQLQPVEIGHQNDIRAEILAGLQLGDSVILHPSDKVDEGVRVRSREDLSTLNEHAESEDRRKDTQGSNDAHDDPR